MHKRVLDIYMNAKYKLIVIGGGISGLSTAIAWMKNREGPVLVMEKEAVPGGCVASFSREGYRFDTVQLIPDMTDLLDYLGIKLPLKKYEGTLSRLFLADTIKGGHIAKFAIEANGEQFEQNLVDTYPSEAKKIKRFFITCRAMIEELSFLTLEPTPLDIIKILIKCPHIIRASGETWKAFLKRFAFQNRELIETLDLFSSYAGLSGNRAAALLTVSAMVLSLASSSRPETAFVQLPDAMRRRAKELGCEVRTHCRAERILFNSDNSVRGVLTSEGEEFLSDTVVSTVDTNFFLNNLIGKARLETTKGSYKKILSRLEMSPSMIAIHLGLDGELDFKKLALDGAYNVLTTGRQAQEEAFRDPDAIAQPTAKTPVDPETGIARSFHIAFYSPSLYNGSTKQTLVIHVSPVGAKAWIDLKLRDSAEYGRAKTTCAKKYIGMLERELIPNLSSHILFVDVSTPATLCRYLGSSSGSCFDMLPTLAQFGLNRLPLRTPFPGLFQTKFSHGIWPAMHSGLQVMDLITGGEVMAGGARYTKKN